MKTPEEIKAAIEAAVAGLTEQTGSEGAGVEIVLNPGPSEQHSLRIPPSRALEIAKFLRDDADLKLDFLSNVTGVDWLDREVEEEEEEVVPTVNQTTEAPDQTAESAEETEPEPRMHFVPGYLEVVYHLYSVEKKHGPVILRMRTIDRTDPVELPSLTTIWRSAEFQEREIFDLYGIIFTGHPDLRRLLMWPEFKDYPMRRDYRPPDDFEYEPTAHDEVLARAIEHQTGAASVSQTEPEAS
jgi:NADH-quinone oxidoreductase subunit C